jgi:predicted MFS family arabinose efflux permease
MRILQIYKNAYSGLSKPIWFLAFILFINRCASMVLLFSSLYMINELHFSQAQAGMVMSCYGVGSITGSYIGGWLSDRYNVVLIMFLSLVASGLLLVSILWITSPLSLGILLFLYALIADVFRPANAVAVKRCSASQNVTRSFSLVRMAINLGFTIAPALGGFFALHYGYSYLFVIDACSTIIAAVVMIMFLKIPNHSIALENKNKVNPISKSAYQDGPYLLFILLVALYGICFFQFISSVPTFLQTQHHYSTNLIGWLLALNGLLVVMIEMPLIAYLEIKQNPSKYIMIGNFCSAIAFSFLLLSNGNLPFNLIFILFITGSEMFTMPFMMNFVTNRPSVERQGQYSALYSMAYAISFICAPLVGLTLSEKIGFNITYTLIIGLSIAVGLGFRWIMKK